MASEQSAKVYEALTAYAVECAAEVGAIRGARVEREVMLPGLSIRTDVVAYDSSSAPLSAYLVTHSNLEVDWTKKFKRDTTELIDMLTGSAIGNIVLVVFERATLPALEKIAKLIFTDVVQVSELDPLGQFQLFAHNDEICRKISKQDDDPEIARAVIRDALMAKPFQRSFQALVSRLAATLIPTTRRTDDATSFLAAARKLIDRRNRAPNLFRLHHTRFNRAISKLAMFPESEWERISAGKKLPNTRPWALLDVYWPLPTSGRPGKGGEKGPLVRPVLGDGVRCVDPEIVGGAVGSSKEGYRIESIFTSLSVDAIRKIVLRGKQGMYSAYMNRITNSQVVIPKALEFVANNLVSLRSEGSLGRLFVEVQSAPGRTFRKLCHDNSQGELGWHWLYTSLVALLKARSKKKQGYGYSKIALRMTTPRYKAAVQHSILQHMEYGLKVLPIPLVAEVASAIALELRDCSREEILGLLASAVRFFVWNEVEDKLIPNGIDVLSAMIEQAALDQHLALERVPLTSCLALAAETAGTAGRANVYKCRSSIIWYKSAHYRQNVLHKKKELQAVIAGIRLAWNGDRRVFSRTKKFKRAVLVIDGDWLDEDLHDLHRFGWDVFLYPHQLGDLGRVIT